jgi:hypothetical protein
MYNWMPIIIIFIIAAIGSISTSKRPPFKSEQVMEIWNNMTKAERTAANKKSIGFGVLTGTILALIPSLFGFIIGIIFLHSALKGMIFAGLVLFPVFVFVLWKAFLPYLEKSWRLFFASTEWAKNRGIQADSIRLFK